MRAERDKIGLILLAAGGSTRMGCPKQLLAFSGGESFLRHACRIALQTPFRPIVVVLGSEAAKCREQIEDLFVLSVVNEAWQEGMAGSLRLGLDTLLLARPAVEQAMVMLADQPGVSAYSLLRLADSGSPLGLAASSYGDVIGVPALFPRDLFPELRALRGDAGARRVLAAHSGRVTLVPLPEAARDIDTPRDYINHLKGESGVEEGFISTDSRDLMTPH
ncbi:molybdenum cofactor cytidylyltransferase/nicotine blue oxidoreductase [Verrucomicrobium sp. GAS474]|uniref:nucleotidyltransferase family protein n=1 Tax=Verrucomicrobium sp. GAS474 TaxID=1882831 RepID=UPI00087C3742|nr:nucleotidyltransferase family protein [Verrucomicrobium sp. GAS474]SDU12066.1 molybdenum cofactor cytidylyltransferase/nicotine blue oxidoreductase [Verrucomicrobium sp. GAS474]